MGEFETNEIDVDNIAQSFVDSPDNIATSDELSLEENFFAKEDTDYAKTKRDDALLKRMSATLGISVTAILGGFVLTNAFAPELPKIENVSQIIQNETLHYSFEIKNKKNYLLTYIVQIDHQDFEGNTINIDKDGLWEGEMSLPSYSKNATITSLLKAKLVDYTKIIGEYTIQGGKENA